MEKNNEWFNYIENLNGSFSPGSELSEEELHTFDQVLLKWFKNLKVKL